MKNTNITNITINGNINATVNTFNITAETSLADLITLLGNVEEEKKTPTPKALRENAGNPIAEEAGCKVYSNGYCVYTNDSGSTVLFVPGCTTFSYKFNGLSDSEIGVLSDHEDISEEEYGKLPWYIALMVRGDHRIEYNSFNRAGDRKRKKEIDDQDDDEKEQTEKKVYRYNAGYHFEGPEAAYIRKETIQEALSKLTDKQREVYLLYHMEGYTQAEIAELLGTSRDSIKTHLLRAQNKIGKLKII